MRPTLPVTSKKASRPDSLNTIVTTGSGGVPCMDGNASFRSSADMFVACSVKYVGSEHRNSNHSVGDSPSGGHVSPW